MKGALLIAFLIPFICCGQERTGRANSPDAFIDMGEFLSLSKMSYMDVEQHLKKNGWVYYKAEVDSTFYPICYTTVVYEFQPFLGGKKAAAIFWIEYASHSGKNMPALLSMYYSTPRWIDPEENCKYHLKDQKYLLEDIKHDKEKKVSLFKKGTSCIQVIEISEDDEDVLKTHYSFSFEKYYFKR